MIRATIPSIRSRLFFFDGFQLSTASVSIEALPAIQRSTGLAPCRSFPARTTSSSFFVGQFMPISLAEEDDLEPFIGELGG